MKEKIKKHELWKTLYDSTVFVHTIITVYVAVIFFLAITNSWRNMPDFRSANLFIFLGILGSQLVRKLNCPLTEFQNWLSEKLRKRKIKRFNAYLLRRCGIKIHYKILDVVHVMLMVCVFASYLIY